MAELVFDVVIDDNVEFAVVEDPQIDLAVLDGNLTVVDFPGIRGEPGTPGAKGDKGDQGDPGPGVQIFTGALQGQLQDGINARFTLPLPASSADAIEVYRNGLLEVRGLSFSSTQNEVMFTSPPLVDDIISVTYPVSYY